MKKIIIIYHANCPDGFSAAWAAWKKFGNKAEYLPTAPGKIPEGDFTDKEIYVLDNSFPLSVQAELRKKNKSVIIIDHHMSTREDVIAFPENIFDNAHSGSVLAWRYFHPKKPVPVLLKYAEDVDLWTLKLPKTREIASYMSGRKFDFSAWSKYARAFETARGRAHCAAIGKEIVRFTETAIEEAVERADVAEFLGHRVLVSNVLNKRFHAALGNTLAKKMPPMGVIWWVSNNELHVSLRSIGSFDVSEIAKQFGGGGHRNAAGLTIPFNGTFPWKVIEKSS